MRSVRSIIEGRIRGAKKPVVVADKRKSGLDDARAPFRLRIEPELHLASLSRRFGFSANFLIGRFKSSQAAHLVHRAFSVELILKTFQRSIDWLPFTNNNFWHIFSIPEMVSLLASCK
jgi:hypothetical protein